MRDEFRRLPGKDEILRRVGAPPFDRLDRRRAVERRVEFRGLEPGSVVKKRVFLADFFGEERPPPRGVMPAGSADQDSRHGWVPGGPMCGASRACEEKRQV